MQRVAQAGGLYVPAAGPAHAWERSYSEEHNGLAAADQRGGQASGCFRRVGALGDGHAGAARVLAPQRVEAVWSRPYFTAA